MALITDITEFRKHLPVAYKTGLKVMPALDRAENDYLLPLIGAALYEELYALGDGGSSLQQKLKGFCNDIVVPFAFASEMPFLQNTISDGGLVALEAENSRKAFKWEYLNAVDSLFLRGYEAQERLLVFLQENRSTFTAWASAPYNSMDFACIRNGYELKSLISIAQPQRCFALLQPIFSQIADLYVIPVLGITYYNALSIRIRAEALLPEEISILPLLRRAFAHLTMKQAATQLTIQFSALGFTIAESAKDLVGEGKHAAATPQINGFAMEMDRVGQSYLKQVTDIIFAQASATVFPEFYTSPQYVNPAPTRDYGNANRKIFIA